LGYGQTGRPPVLVMVCGYSRWMSAIMIPSRQGPDLLAGQWQLIRRLGAAPKVSPRATTPMPRAPQAAAFGTGAHRLSRGAIS
jgi:hypothetical protein